MGRNDRMLAWCAALGLGLGAGLLLACGPRVPVQPGIVAAAAPAGIARDPLAVGWALKAAVSDARGDVVAAERAHGWVSRLDRGRWARLHQADFERSRGRVDDARVLYGQVVGTAELDDPAVERAMLGLGLLEASSEGADRWLAPLVDRYPCRILEGAISGSLRTTARARCAAR